MWDGDFLQSTKNLCSMFSIYAEIWITKENRLSIRGIADFTRISMTAKIYSTIGLDIHGSAFLIPSGGWFAVWRERTNAHSADSHFGHQRCNHRG